MRLVLTLGITDLRDLLKEIEEHCGQRGMPVKFTDQPIGPTRRMNSSDVDKEIARRKDDRERRRKGCALIRKEFGKNPGSIRLAIDLHAEHNDQRDLEQFSVEQLRKLYSYLKKQSESQ